MRLAHALDKDAPERRSEARQSEGPQEYDSSAVRNEMDALGRFAEALSRESICSCCGGVKRSY